MIPETRLTRNVFDWDRRYSSTRGTWSYAAREVLNELKLIDSFKDVTPCNIKSATENIKDIDVNLWDMSRYKSQKLRYYNLYKYDKSPEEYLMLDITKY